jgi:hypothetical protein
MLRKSLILIGVITAMGAGYAMQPAPDANEPQPARSTDGRNPQSQAKLIENSKDEQSMRQVYPCALCPLPEHGYWFERDLSGIPRLIWE